MIRRGLLLSAYAADSHRHWREQLQEMLPDWRWTWLELPPRHFSWRVRGNPLYWSLSERKVLEGDYELLLATSMVDLATLRGLVPPLAHLPAALYFHENQFDYPRSSRQDSLLEAQMVSLYSALAADRLVFNSAFNRDGFLRGLGLLLERFPDHVPRGVVEGLRDRSEVLPVPVPGPGEVAPSRACWPETEGVSSRPLRLLWLGRFEHDKGGDRLLRILQGLESNGLDFDLAVVGRQFRNSPDAFGQIAQQFRSRLVQFGFIRSRETYLGLLRSADMVLSTALHEFQGLAVMEAVAAGCVPVLPARQAYPEIYPAEFLYPDCGADIEAEASGAVRRIVALAEPVIAGSVAPPPLWQFSPAALAPRYRHLLDSLAAEPV